MHDPRVNAERLSPSRVFRQCAASLLLVALALFALAASAANVTLVGIDEARRKLSPEME